METGTGKSYVYFLTFFEKLRFCKFIIVVSSIAIKEEVYKSLQITNEHFKLLIIGFMNILFYGIKNWG